MAKNTSKKQYPNPDTLNSELQKQAEEQEKIEAQIEELELAKSTFKSSDIPIPANLEAKLEELKSSSPKNLAPDWAKNSEWIEHLKTKQTALNSAIEALSSTKGADIERIKSSLLERLAKVDKVLSAPKEDLHGLSHADYASRVNQVITSADVENEGSEENIKAQISQLHEDLASYEEAYNAGTAADLQNLHNQTTELSARKERLEKILKKYEGKTEGERKLIFNIERLIAQIDLNLKDLQNKNVAKGRAALQRGQIVMASLQDKYQEYAELREVHQHYVILAKSGIDIDEESKKKAQETVEQLESALQKVKEELKQIISQRLYETNHYEGYWESILQQTFIGEFKEWTLDAVEGLEEELDEKTQVEEVTPEEMSEIMENVFGSSYKYTTVKDTIDEYAGGSISTIRDTTESVIKKLEHDLLFRRQWLVSYNSDLERLKQLKAEAKGVLGNRKKKKELIEFQAEIYRLYNQYCPTTGNKVNRADGKADNGDILTAKIKEYEKVRDIISKELDLNKKFLSAVEAEDAKRLLDELQSLKEKLEKGDKS